MASVVLLKLSLWDEALDASAVISFNAITNSDMFCQLSI